LRDHFFNRPTAQACWNSSNTRCRSVFLLTTALLDPVRRAHTLIRELASARERPMRFEDRHFLLTFLKQSVLLFRWFLCPLITLGQMARMRSSNTDVGSYSRPSRRASSAESVYKGLGKEKCCESGGISGNFGGASADLRPPGGALDEHCFILSRTGGTGVKSAPCGNSVEEPTDD
jgi:hypothetical protein